MHRGVQAVASASWDGLKEGCSALGSGLALVDGVLTEALFFAPATLGAWARVCWRVMAEVYTKSFCFGLVCTALGHHLANAKTKEKKRRLPFIDPGRLDAFPWSFLPRGTSAVITVSMGVLWATIMGSALATLVLMLWFSMGASPPPGAARRASATQTRARARVAQA